MDNRWVMRRLTMPPVVKLHCRKPKDDLRVRIDDTEELLRLIKQKAQLLENGNCSGRDIDEMDRRIKLAEDKARGLGGGFSETCRATIGMMARPPADSRLQLRGLGIRHVPQSVMDRTNLTHLNLGSNEIEHIPCSISRMVDLAELHLRFNKIREIPDEISTLKKLKLLNYTNSVTLETLDLSRNGLTDIPLTYIGALPMLQSLNIKGNYLPTEFTMQSPEDFAQYAKEAYFQKKIISLMICQWKKGDTAYSRRFCHSFSCNVLYNGNTPIRFLLVTDCMYVVVGTDAVISTDSKSEESFAPVGSSGSSSISARDRDRTGQNFHRSGIEWRPEK
ncbi:hypothetical protein Pelo_17869 [Pelomyxa schiedti]|nr:hypothetical protein Pelo_17869 [Pelomyxa schiedti]